MSRKRCTFGWADSRPSVLAVLLAGILVAVFPAFAPAGADDTADERFTVIKAGKVIPIVGKDITDGMIVLVNGKVRSVGKGLEFPKNARVIDATDRVVMPGLINVYSRYGLPSYARSGVHGNYTVADEYFPSAGEYDDLIQTGYVVLALVPEGQGIPGRALVLHTGGPPAQRSLVSPSYLRVGAEKLVLRAALERAQQEIDKVEKARKDFEEQQKKAPPASQPASQPGAPSQPASAPASQPAFQPPPIDPAHQVLVDLIQKKEGLFALIELRSASDYLHISEVLKKTPIAHQFLLRNATSSDLYRVVDGLGGEKAKVVCWPLMNRVPSSIERVPIIALLAKAGCEISIVPANDSVDEHRRVLERLAELVRDGWSREDALKSVTLNPARLLGLESRLGAIEKDREADFIFLDADPLKPGARVREVMIDGEIVRKVER